MNWFHWLLLLVRRNQNPLKEEANELARIIIKQLTRMGMCYVKQTKEVDIFQEVEFVNPLVVKPDCFEFEVDVSRLPRGISLAQLKEPELLETISTACKRKVTVRHDRRAGFWFVVERSERQRGNFYYRDLKPPNKTSPLLIPIGRDDAGRQLWCSLAKMPHLLIAGATGGGKTTMIHSILCWLITHYEPDELRLIIVDLKEGLDLIRYDGVPHLLRPVVYERDDALETLEWTFEEIKRRGEDMRVLRASDIFSYRRRSKEHIPFIVFIFDEIANLHLLPNRQKNRAWSLIKDSAQRARALGINLVFATQRPSVDVIDGDIKANFTTRIAFGCSSEIDSRVIINSGEAFGLPVGDLIYLDRNGTKRLRGVYITENQVDKIVAQIVERYERVNAAKQQEERKQLERLADLETRMLEYARELGGDFPVETMFNKFGDEATLEEVKRIARALEERGVLEPARGRRPRRLAG